jgi:flagellar protein FlaI
MFIPPDHKVVSIEETREINLPHENWVADVTREADLGQDRPGVDTYTLLSEALHQRPDHILVGEIRTDPAVVRTFFQAVGTGHAGFTTFHAESARDALRRLRHDPLSVPDELLTDIDIISTQRLLTLGDERVRRTRGLTELREAEDGTPALREVFTHDPADDAVEQVESSAVLGEVAEAQGWSTADLETELRRRRRVLGALLAEGTTGYETVTRWLFRFARDPERTMDDLGVADADSETSRTALDAGPYGSDPIRFADGD